MMNTALQYGVWLAAAAVLLLFLKRRRARKGQGWRGDNRFPALAVRGLVPHGQELRALESLAVFTRSGPPGRARRRCGNLRDNDEKGEKYGSGDPGSDVAGSGRDAGDAALAPPPAAGGAVGRGGAGGFRRGRPRTLYVD